MIEQTLTSISQAEKINGQNEGLQYTRLSSSANSDPVEAAADQQTVGFSEKEPINRVNQVANTLKEVELKFVPDEESNQITVYVVDKESRNILRSIPPEEIGKLDAGDLLELAA